MLGFLLLCKNYDGFRPVVEVLNVSVVFVEGNPVSCSGGRNAFPFVVVCCYLSLTGLFAR